MGSIDFKMAKLKVFFILTMFSLCGDEIRDSKLFKTQSVLEGADERPEIKLMACDFFDSFCIFILEGKNYTQRLSMKSGSTMVLNLKLVEDMGVKLEESRKNKIYEMKEPKYKNPIGKSKYRKHLHRIWREILENCAYWFKHVLRHLGAEFRRPASFDFYPYFFVYDLAFIIAFLFSVIFLCIFKLFRQKLFPKNLQNKVSGFVSQKPFATRVHRQTEFQPGDLVYVEIACRLNGMKMNAVKSGPYVIIKRVSRVTYEVDFINKCKNFVNISKITPFVIKVRKDLNICN